MFFKGISVTGFGDSSVGLSGIGVVMERAANVPVIQVQKKLDFYVEEPVADYLALMDGLVEAVQNNVRRVYAFTDSELLYDQGVESLENCSICCDDKPSPMMITMKCSHKFCTHCMRTYVDGKVQSSQVPIRCPQLRCMYYISTAECKSFLPLTSFEFYCPFPNCSVLLDRSECSSASESSSIQSDNSCMECPVCKRFICVDCGVPWHSSMSCEEFQNLPLEERDSADITLHRLAQNKSWRRCQQCRRMIELYSRCGHEFCYACGAEYRDGQQTCQCAFWDEDNPEDLVTQSMQESEQWAWETFNSLPMIMDAYSEQERSQLALIQRFLAGGFSLSDHHPYQPAQSPPRCTDAYVDAMKDLHQLPWLERFVSVISDNYYEEYIQ
ncbi:hypothetical protein J5N97_000687 [Dioscorea zingiberensis]|uniref:RBR-type E3 ubiquitin transferase n=1 Tax=Dioscorea zingiberensis TaxID=325984 RepID=A0A9D5H387_9LILI|nr:hypothetical protein J5N97_000687 [Dioscorea zingiberensis]